jgi:hypothetical protein
MEESERDEKNVYVFHINGLFVLTVEVVALNVDGINGGGNVEPVVNPTLADEVSSPSVGGFITLANGFGARGAVEPKGLVAPRSDRLIIDFLVFGCYLWVQ